jgi:Flp pilus assembly protein TadD
VENTDPALARRLLREALESDPTNEVALQNLALKTLIDEDTNAARDLAKRCVEVNDQSVVCQHVLKEAPEMTPDLERLTKFVRGCAAQQPNNVECLAGMVNVHLLDGNVVDAAVYAGRLAHVAPVSDETSLAQGRIDAASGRYGQALRLFEQACSANNEKACFRAHALQSEGW